MFIRLLLASLLFSTAYGQFRAVLLARKNAPTIPWSDDPANYATGMKIWLKADNLITNSGSGALSGWGDSSGNGNRAIQATGGAQPTVVTNAYAFGNTVQFDGSADFMATPTIVLGLSAQPWTIIFCGRLRTATDDSTVLSLPAVNNQALRLALAATNSVGMYNGDGFESSAGTALSNGCKFVSARGFGTLYAIRNNAASNSVATLAPPLISFSQLGAYPDFGLFAPVDISELIVWTNRALTEAELNSLYTNYFKIKYGITLP